MTAAGRAAAGACEWVVLVHGLLRTQRSMRRLDRGLSAAGFCCERWRYRSWRGRIAEESPPLAAELERLDDDPAVGTLHLVGHSFGNILLRAALARARPRKLGRFVQLVPPNLGSPAARLLAPLFGAFVPALRELSSAEGSDVRRLAVPPGLEVGVIAARFDHLVRERSTHLEGERAHVVLRTTHVGVLTNRAALEEIVQFLRFGRFLRQERSG